MRRLGGTVDRFFDFLLDMGCPPDQGSNDKTGQNGREGGQKKTEVRVYADLGPSMEVSSGPMTPILETIGVTRRVITLTRAERRKAGR